MDDIWMRIVEDMTERVSGPLHFRLMLQPLMAVIFAIRSGLKDARMANPPYFWALFTNPDHRRQMLADGWKSIGKVFILAIILDVVYQFMVQGFIYPGEALVVAFVLAIVPYLLLRGLVTRIAQKRGR